MGREPIVIIAEYDEVVRLREDPETPIDQDDDGVPAADLRLQPLDGPPAGFRLKPRIPRVALEIGDEGPLELLVVDLAADDLLVHGGAVIGHDGGKGSRAAELRVLLNER